MNLSTKKYIEMDKSELMLEYNKAKLKYDEYNTLGLQRKNGRGGQQNARDSYRSPNSCRR